MVMLQKTVTEKPSTAFRELENAGGPRGVNTPSCEPWKKELQSFYRQCITSDYSGWYCLSVQSHGCLRLFETPWIAARQASLSSTNSGVHSDSRPSSRWCHPSISSSVVPFSSSSQSLPASKFFQWVNRRESECTAYKNFLTLHRS